MQRSASEVLTGINTTIFEEDGEDGRPSSFRFFRKRQNNNNEKNNNYSSPQGKIRGRGIGRQRKGNNSNGINVFGFRRDSHGAPDLPTVVSSTSTEELTVHADETHSEESIKGGSSSSTGRLNLIHIATKDDDDDDELLYDDDSRDHRGRPRIQPMETSRQSPSPSRSPSPRVEQLPHEYFQSATVNMAGIISTTMTEYSTQSRNPYGR